MNTASRIAIVTGIALGSVTTSALPKPECAQLKPFFYSVEKSGHRFYLLGTVHIGMSFANLHERVRKAFREANKVAFEADRDALKPLYARVRETATDLPKGQTLRDVLKPESISTLRTLLGNDTIESIMTYAPWFVLESLELMARPPSDQGLDEQYAEGLDATMVREARRSGKSLSFLDRNIEQLVTHDWLAPASTLDQYLSRPDPFEHTRQCDERTKMVMCSGSERAMLDYVYGDCMDESERDDVFRRSAAWMSDLIELHGKVFVAVGAAHLIGPNGIVALLRQQGFTVTLIED